MMHLDTHVVVWLYAGELSMLTTAARSALDADDLCVSPAVLLELQYLLEIKRIAVGPDRIMHALDCAIGLAVADMRFGDVVQNAIEQTWTRDPFDRLIVASAALQDAPLLSKDATILRHYSKAFWSRRPGSM